MLIEEIEDSSRRIDFNSLIYRYKGESDSKHFVGFKGLLIFYKNIKEGHIKLQKAEENQFKLKINEIIKGGEKKSEDQKSAINKIKTLSESREKVIKLFDDYSRIGESLKILTSNKCFKD